MFKRSKTVQAGFTITEVLIVLAVAGIIFAIVFRAIPALIRDNRNSQRKQDIGIILQAVSKYELNNSGDFPKSCGSPGTLCDVAAAGLPNDYFLRFDKDKLDYYETGNVHLLHQSNVTGDPNLAVSRGPVTDTNRVEVYNYERCDSANYGRSTVTGAGFNDVVALYSLENGTANGSAQCIEL